MRRRSRSRATASPPHTSRCEAHRSSSGVRPQERRIPEGNHETSHAGRTKPEPTMPPRCLHKAGREHAGIGKGRHSTHWSNPSPNQKIRSPFSPLAKNPVPLDALLQSKSTSFHGVPASLAGGIPAEALSSRPDVQAARSTLYSPPPGYRKTEAELQRLPDRPQRLDRISKPCARALSFLAGIRRAHRGQPAREPRPADLRGRQDHREHPHQRGTGQAGRLRLPVHRPDSALRKSRTPWSPSQAFHPVES